MTEIETKLQDIFRDVLRDSELEMKPELTAFDIKGWDSFNNMRIIAKIQKQFNLRFKAQDIVGLNNFGELVLAVTKKIYS